MLLPFPCSLSLASRVIHNRLACPQVAVFRFAPSTFTDRLAQGRPPREGGGVNSTVSIPREAGTRRGRVPTVFSPIIGNHYHRFLPHAPPRAQGYFKFLFLRQVRIGCRFLPTYLSATLSHWHPGRGVPFVMYEFPETTPVIHFEHHSSGAFVHADHNVQEYRKAIALLTRRALDPEQSLARIGETIKEQEDRL